MMNSRLIYKGCFPVFLFLLFFLPGLSPAQDNNLDLGKKFFEGKCARCHGKDGAGNPKMVALLKTSLNKINLHQKKVADMSIFQIESMIDTGKHRMPKYRGKLTDSQIHDIAEYVKMLIGNETEKVNEVPK